MRTTAGFCHCLETGKPPRFLNSHGCLAANMGMFVWGTSENTAEATPWAKQKSATTATHVGWQRQKPTIFL